MRAVPPLASFFGLRSWTLIFLRFFAAILFSFLLGLGVSDTEEALLPAFDVLFWNQVIQANQLLFFAPGPLTC